MYSFCQFLHFALVGMPKRTSTNKPAHFLPRSLCLLDQIQSLPVHIGIIVLYWAGSTCFPVAVAQGKHSVLVSHFVESRALIKSEQFCHFASSSNLCRLIWYSAAAVANC